MKLDEEAACPQATSRSRSSPGIARFSNLRTERWLHITASTGFFSAMGCLCPLL